MIDGIGATELLHIFISHDEAHARAGRHGQASRRVTSACVMDDAGHPLPRGPGRPARRQGPDRLPLPADDRQRQYVQHGWNYTGDAYLVDADG